jgi:hypothetical protein
MPTQWNNFLQEVAPDVSGCPKSVMRNAVRNSAIEFCNESRAWRTQITDITTAIGTKTYSLTVPTDSEVIMVSRLLIVGDVRPLPTLSNKHLNRYKIATDNGRPNFYNSEIPGQVSFYPTPDAIYTGEVFCVLKPTKASLEGPDFLFNDWLDAIAAGAKARLMAMAGRPWTNVKLVKLHRATFVRGYVEARIRDAKSNVESSSDTRPQSFGFYRGRRV